MRIKTPEEVKKEISHQLKKEGRSRIQRCTMCGLPLTPIRRKDTKNTGFTCTNRDCMLGININKVDTWEVIR